MKLKIPDFHFLEVLCILICNLYHMYMYMCMMQDTANMERYVPGSAQSITIGSSPFSTATDGFIFLYTNSTFVANTPRIIAFPGDTGPISLVILYN